jgi:DNA mismatch repair ATPase MutS
MALDGVTLLNLQILENEIDGKVDGTLLKYMDHTQTAFGKRMIRTWVAEPLMRVSDIEARLDAVEELMDLKQLYRSDQSQHR